MAVIQSVGELENLTDTQWPSMSYGALRMYDQYTYDYATLYKTQPNVRTCVDFLARNIAQLGLHVFRRISDTDRVRLMDHPLSRVLSNPLPPEFKVTRYRLIETLMGDMGVYFNAYWLKFRPATAPLYLLRIPPQYMTPYGGLVPTYYEVNVGGKLYTYAPSEIVHFRGYNAENAVQGLPNLETLRRVLAEEHAAGDYREHFWQNAARMSGIIERPKDAPEWSDLARQRFKQEFEALYAGGDNSGKTAILEEGMTWRAGTFNAQESEYLAGRKLTREECARAYHIPLPMVGILDNATFSNIKEQHKNLYQDSLGPWLAMIEQEIELQLLTEFTDTQGVYVEFNIAEKLQGSFEEQVTALQSAVGRPWMTANEARAKLNLPSLGEDADQLVTPLNVLVGGQASPRDSAPKTAGGAPPAGGTRGAQPAEAKSADELNPTHPELRDRYRERWTRLMAKMFERQRQEVISIAGAEKSKTAVPDIAVLWDGSRWNTELATDVHRLSYVTSKAFADYVAEQLGTEFDDSETLAYLEESSRIAAENINLATRSEIEAALQADDVGAALKKVFELALAVRALQIATSRTTAMANFGAHEAAKQGGIKTKTWHVNSPNPRPRHARLSGASVGIKELFGNGLMWPGDPRGSADENACCTCSITFGR